MNNDAVAKTLDGRNHFCHDENATIVNGRWLCGCPGGPFISRAEYMRRQLAAVHQELDELEQLAMLKTASMSSRIPT